MTDQKLSLREACAELARYIGNAERGVSTAVLQTVLDAASSTLPKTKMVEVWHVEYALHSRCPAIYLFNEKETADKQAAFMQKHAAEHGWHCIRVTGPHTQEVPA